MPRQKEGRTKTFVKNGKLIRLRQYGNDLQVYSYILEGMSANVNKKDDFFTECQRLTTDGYTEIKG